jgi:hypothetical protein
MSFMTQAPVVNPIMKHTAYALIIFISYTLLDNLGKLCTFKKQYNLQK